MPQLGSLCALQRAEGEGTSGAVGNRAVGPTSPQYIIGTVEFAASYRAVFLLRT